LKWRFGLSPTLADSGIPGISIPGAGQYDEESRAFSPVFPAVSRGVLYLNLGREQAPPGLEDGATYPLLAVHLRTGCCVSGPTVWEDSIPYYIPGAPRHLSVREPVLDTGGSEGMLLVVRSASGAGEGTGPWKLAALDLSARTDTCSPPPVLWDWRPEGNGILLGPGPATDGKRVYVSFCEAERDILHYVAGLDARTGKELWRTFVSSFPQPQNTMLQPSPLLARRGKVFYASNMGTVAALDGETGAPAWVFKYGIPQSAGIPVWYSNRLVLADGVLVASPREFPFLIALEPDSGRPLWSFWEFFDWDRFVNIMNTRFREVGEKYDSRYRHVLGTGRGILVYTSRTQVHARTIADGRLAWINSIGMDITGRGCITGDRVYVPTRKGVVVLDLFKGRRTGSKEFLVEWSAFKESGEEEILQSSPGGNLEMVHARRSWCFKTPEGGGMTCRGRLERAADGSLRCVRCGRVHDGGDEFYLVVAGREEVQCFGFEKPEAGSEEKD
jgi:outer membrane protein assembly factor BamB